MHVHPVTGHPRVGFQVLEIVDARQTIDVHDPSKDGPDYLCRLAGLPLDTSRHSRNWLPTSFFEEKQPGESFRPLVTEFWKTHVWTPDTLYGMLRVFDRKDENNQPNGSPASYTVRL